jgi:hypothetical protein
VVIAPSCAEIHATGAKTTEAQWKEYLQSLKGKWVKDWKGKVTDVKAGGLGIGASGYTLQIDCGKCDLLLTVMDKELALKLFKGQVVTATGPIKFTDDTFLGMTGKLSVYLEDAPAVTNIVAQ